MTKNHDFAKISRISGPFNDVHVYSPPFYALPTMGYGGSERIVAGEIDYFLRQRNNRNTVPFNTVLWAPGDSYAAAPYESRPRLVPTVPKALGGNRALEGVSVIMNDLHNLRNIMKEDFHAAAHFHIEDLHFPLFGQDIALASRTLTTVHNSVKAWQKEYGQMPLVAISHAQKKLLGIENFDFVEVVYNGVNETLYTPHYDLEENAPLTYLGRFSPNKNPAGAVRIALASGVPIHMAGPSDPEHPGCLEEIHHMQKVHGPERVLYAGSVSDEYDAALGQSGKSAFLGSSRALMFPIQWKEPFGLVVIEANACGTPVIAFDHPGSSVSELIVNGVNGFKVHTEAEAAEAVRLLPSLDRRKVREHFEQNFTADVMARKYADIFMHKLPRYHREMTASHQRRVYAPAHYIQ